MSGVYFSDLHQLPDPDQYEWFDPILERDTQLFVDPFLIFDDGDAEWRTAHDEIMNYFQDAFTHLANAGMKPGHQYYKLAMRLMMFPEVREIRLGYAAKDSHDGLGSGKGFAQRMVDAMCEAIKRGLNDMRHFEELGILVDGIGRDRISDITCNLLRPRLIGYTQHQCNALDIPMASVSVDRAVFDARRRRWVAAEHKLPVDERGRPILLVPKRFLNLLPTINAEAWYEHLRDSELRDDLNLEIASAVRKADIIKLARQHTDDVRAWVDEKEETGAEPYDVDTDPAVYAKWLRYGREVADRFPLKLETAIPLTSLSGLTSFVAMIVSKFRHVVEERGLWRVMWQDTSHTAAIPEPNMQLIFMATVDRYCEEAGVSMDREVETGRGPVDFVFTTGPRLRVILEVKKLTNGEFWNGLDIQTPIYMRSLRVTRATFLAIRDSSSKNMDRRWEKLTEMASAASRPDRTITIEGVDILPKLSASKVR